MSDDRAAPNYTQQFTLPSGRQIQVVYYAAGDGSCEQDLGWCGSCACTLVQPLTTEPVGRSHWRVSLRCPNCLWVGTAVLDEQALDLFEQARGRDIDVIRRELVQISLANMIEDAERFVEALDGDHILPSDF